MSTQLIKKHKTLPFINAGTSDNPKWVQIKKATEFTHSLNPETEERDYISDEQATTELMNYKPSMSLSVTTIEGEADFDLFYSLYKAKATGEDAKREYMIVYVFDDSSAGGTDYYFAYKTDATITIDEFNSVESSISASIYENGTPTKGFVRLEDGVPVFTEGDLPEAEEEQAEEEDTSDIVTVQKAYGAYSVADSIKEAIQENYLSKLTADYGLDYDGELSSFDIEIAAAQKITATLVFACGSTTAHWPTTATLSLPGKYVFVAGADEGKVSSIKWNYDKMEHTAAYTGAHNTGVTEHADGETEHTAGEAAAIRAVDATAAKQLAREVAEKYLAAPWTFDGETFTDAEGELVAN